MKRAIFRGVGRPAELQVALEAVAHPPGLRRLQGMLVAALAATPERQRWWVDRALGELRGLIREGH